MILNTVKILNSETKIPDMAKNFQKFKNQIKSMKTDKTPDLNVELTAFYENLMDRLEEEFNYRKHLEQKLHTMENRNL